MPNQIISLDTQSVRAMDSEGYEDDSPYYQAIIYYDGRVQGLLTYSNAEDLMDSLDSDMIEETLTAWDEVNQKSLVNILRITREYMFNDEMRALK